MAARAAPRDKKWLGPLGGMTKGNTDAVVNRVETRDTTTAIFYDNSIICMEVSTVVVASGLQEQGTLEELACREALTLAQGISIRQTTIASECVGLVHAIIGGNQGRYNMEITTINSRRRAFEQPEFKHEARESKWEACDNERVL